MQLVKRYAGIISVGSMIILLVVAYFFDSLVDVRHNPNPSGNVYLKLVSLRMWFIPLWFLVLAICLLLLFWFVIYHGKRNIVISVFFIAVGSCILFLPPLSYSGWLSVPFPPFMNWLGRDRWFLLSTSAFVAAIGFLGLIFPRQRLN
jgi:hypothetical protein